MTTEYYGSVVQDVMLPCKDGTEYKWSMANPFALLAYLAEVNAGFAHFMSTHLSGRTSNLICWGDETTPGNALRPDSSTKVVALYFSFIEFPDYFRHGDYGWLPIGTVGPECTYKACPPPKPRQ